MYVRCVLTDVLCLTFALQVLLQNVAQVYTDEIKNVKYLPALYMTYSETYLNTLTTSVHQIIAILTVLGSSSPLMCTLDPTFRIRSNTSLTVAPL